MAFTELLPQKPSKSNLHIIEKVLKSAFLSNEDSIYKKKRNEIIEVIKKYVSILSEYPALFHHLFLKQYRTNINIVTYLNLGITLPLLLSILIFFCTNIVNIKPTPTSIPFHTISSTSLPNSSHHIGINIKCHPPLYCHHNH